MRALAEALPNNGDSNNNTDDESFSVVNLDKVMHKQLLVRLVFFFVASI
jgi:hypothetical protein